MYELNTMYACENCEFNTNSNGLIGQTLEFD